MSYQVLARRWRPKIFAELVGQEHVVRALSNALDNDRLHHAYLFTGTRGVGKTTIARILAKSLNCETGVTAQPCGECSVCREVDEGRFVDLIEVDAASKTGVDDTRELLDNVPYAPVRGRYKVYLIDEVHMFSNHSFNALLKTLEEPPPHVKFILATTDPQKVPVTVLSRCLQFSLKRLPADLIEQQLLHILQSEQINAEQPALQRLARAAEGSMRDGLSLLDQAIAFGGGEVQEEAVCNMLGVNASDELPGILQDIHCGNANAAIQRVHQLAQLAPDFSGLLKDLLMLLHRISLLQATPDVWHASWGDPQAVQVLADELTPEDSQLYYQIALLGQRDLPLAPDAQSGFEMILLRMLAFRPNVEGIPAPAAKPVAKPEPVARAPAPGQAKPAPQASLHDFADWHQVLPRLLLEGMAAQLAQNCVIQNWDGKTLSLKVDASCASMLGTKAQERLQQALNDYHGAPVKLQLMADGSTQDTPAQRQAHVQAERQKQAETDIANDPLVLAMQETFAAEVVPGSIRLRSE
jgi:DNA polymerase-3 subunit gamma/tau